MQRFMTVIKLQIQIKINIHKRVCDNIQGKRAKATRNLKQAQAKMQTKQLECQHCLVHLGLGDCEAHFLEKRQKGLGMSHSIH